LRRVIKAYIRQEGADQLRSRTSAEDGREKVATEMMQLIHERHPAFAVAYLDERRKLRRKR